MLAQANVFVSFHGAGQNYALFMEHRSAMIEIRPRHFGGCLLRRCRLTSLILILLKLSSVILHTDTENLLILTQN